MTDDLLNKALGKATQGNRNETGFWLACQLRDNGYSEGEAEGIMLDCRPSAKCQSVSTVSEVSVRRVVRSRHESVRKKNFN